MGNRHTKEDELKSMANLIISSQDYQTAMQKLNGMRMGLTNRYKISDESKFDNFKKIKRLNAWKSLLEAYK